MVSSELPAPTWIATPASLKKLTDELARCSRIAVDTESNSLHAFREQLCLIQFSTDRVDYLVDPLAIDDLSLLNPIFANPRIEKVFHAVEYDLICLSRDLGVKVVNLFDTMQAARILGCKQVGLDSVIAARLGIALDKKYQKADWGKRPLTREMLDYARFDTHYLLELRDSLQAELEQRGRWALAQEEFSRLAFGNSNGKPEVPAWQRVKGAQKCNNLQLAILHELCKWREDQARSMNRPVFRVLDDYRLVDIATSAPEDQDALADIGLTDRQIDLYGNRILQAVSRGKRSPAISRPRVVRPKQAYLDRLNRLTEWRKTAALKEKVESDVVLPKPWMARIAEKDPVNAFELSQLMPNAPWRLEHFGEDILKALHKKGSTIPKDTTKE